MTDDLYLGIVERIEQAMCVFPFQPREEDVIVLLSESANARTLRLQVEDLERVIERLKTDKALLLAYVQEVDSDANNAQLDIARLLRRLGPDT